MPQEIERQQTLDRYELIFLERDQGLDRLVDLMRRQFKVDVATISIMDRTTQYLKASAGEACGTRRRNDAICDQVISSQSALLIDNNILPTT